MSARVEVRRVSQFRKPLWNILHDQGSLSTMEYWIQFLISKNCLHLLQFWLSVDSFKNASSSLNKCPSRPLAAESRQVEWAAVDCLATAGALAGQDSERVSSCKASVSQGVQNSLPKGKMKPQSPVELQSQEAGTSSALNGVGRKVVVDGDMTKGSQSNTRSQELGGELARQTSLNVVTDAMGIYTTYIALNALTPIGLPDEMRQKVEIDICPEDGVVDRMCFNEAQAYVFSILEDRYHRDFLSSSFLCKYQLELVSSGGHCLLDFLMGEDQLSYFREFMEQENAMSLLQFWLTAESFHTYMLSLDKHSDTEADTRDAITIYDRYFSLQATEPLEMGDKVRVDIEIRICDEQGPQPHSFVAAQRIAYDRMNENYYPNFLESGIYLKFLDDLLRMVKSTPDLPPQDTVSDTATNTNSGERIETETTGYFTYDVDDPDSLWRRPQLLMRLGYVDEMGHYCSEIVPFPTKTGKSRGHQYKFQRFRNRHEQEEWELAIKISRSIVNKVLKRTSRPISCR